MCAAHQKALEELRLEYLLQLQTLKDDQRLQQKRAEESHKTAKRKEEAEAERAFEQALNKKNQVYRV